MIKARGQGFVCLGSPGFVVKGKRREEPRSPARLCCFGGKRRKEQRSPTNKPKISLQVTNLKSRIKLNLNVVVGGPGNNKN